MAMASAVAAALTVGFLLASDAGGATVPQFAGEYPTSVKILIDTTKSPLPVGMTSVRTWLFAPRCAAASCSTLLLRPSIIPGRSLVFAYELHRIAVNLYRATLDVPDGCVGPTKVFPFGSVIDHEVITLRPTRVRGLRIVAFSGTMAIAFVSSLAGKAHGCFVHAYQEAKVQSPA